MATRKKQDSSDSDNATEASPADDTAKPVKKKSKTASETAGTKAKSAAKKVAAAVSDTVKDLAEKVVRKTTKTSTTKRTTAKDADSSSEAAAPKSATTRRTSTRAAAADPGDAPKPARKVSNRTKTAALIEGTTSDDVQNTIMDLANSEDVPAEHNPESDAATDVREHFFAEHQGPPPPQPPRDLPDEYGDTKIVLLVRDPEWVYAYWEVNDETRAQLNFPREGNGSHGRRLVLRIYKITNTSWPIDAAHYFFDTEVPADARNWYIHLPEADQQWCAELGLVENDDTFVTICRSNPVVTPRNTISDRIDSEWMTVEESFEKITRMSGADLQAQLLGGGPTSSEALLRTINRQLTAVLHGEKPTLSSGIFSSEAALPTRQNKKFWLQVHTELILYGATEPDAKVTVQGRPVTLNGDGTFSMRFSLPDGIQILDVKAVNADGDLEEEITPVVERTTR